MGKGVETMIKARRLFLFPAVSAIILLPMFPVGLVIWLGVVALWYTMNHEKVDTFIFQGRVYTKHEYADVESLK